jgi:glycosyltransferase involved in cell wall biosynthesis
MKVLFVTTESTIDHCYTMIKELRNHVELTVYISAKEITPEIKEYCGLFNAAFFRRASFKNPLALFKDLKFLRGLKKKKADLVWFSGMSFYQALFLKLFIRSFLINIHDVELHHEEKDFHGIMTQKLIYRFYKKNIAVMSNSQAEIFKKQFNLQPVVLQLPIIDYYDSAAPAVKGAQLTARRKIKFFFFGAVMPYKGIETLIESANILSSKSLEFSLNVYGKINYNSNYIQEKISLNKNITLADNYIDYKEVSAVFAANDVIIIPYKQVSQCGPLLIAYRQCVPVICSNLPGFLEYVTDIKSGLIFNNTAEGLAAKMEYLIRNPEAIETMSNFIKNEIHGKFSMKNLAQSYVAVFEKSLLKKAN